MSLGNLVHLAGGFGTMPVMHSTFGCLAAIALVAAPVLAAAPTDEIDLYSGVDDLVGWEFVTTPAPLDIERVCKTGPNGVLAAAGRPIGFIETKTAYENYRLHFEWRWPGPAGNGGLLLHISSGPKDRQWPVSLQIQLKSQAAGDVLPMAGARCAELASPTATQVARKEPASEKALGQWNTGEVVCRGDTIECYVNGVLQNRVTRCTPRMGKIGFQFEGTPFELRNIRLSPLK